MLLASTTRNAGDGETQVKTSTDRILTTHTGSLPRPAALTDRNDDSMVREAVAETVRRQRDAGVDVVNDGEASKPSYATYVQERLSGFGGDPVFLPMRGLEEFPEFVARMAGDPEMAAVFANPACNGPVAYQDTSKVDADIANLSASADGATEVFMTAASPGVIEMFMPNRYYPGTEDYISALADAMKTEYDAIHQAGFVLQVDCPDLAIGWNTSPEELTLSDFRRTVAQRLAALDHATRDIPADRLRLHLCWGNYEGPHVADIPLADIIDLVLAARPAAVSFEGANPRHEHEWAVFEDVKLPDGKAIIPGVLDSTTNYVEHPELIAQRIVRYADLVGRENVLAGSDCGFATFSGYVPVDPKVTWAKLAAMTEGARLASARLWGRP
jgi:5-methyltetrahydropteroyltriglutamate--homocysteine methyltransferase